MSARRVLLASLASAALASPLNCTSNSQAVALTQPYYPPTADCIEFKVSVTITSENNIFNLPRWNDDFALQDFLNLATTRAEAGIPSPIIGKQNETATHMIAASFCTPKTPGKKTIILATHGIGQARTHWNSAFDPEQFNFVQHAISQGFSVWFYDRLGTGESEKYAMPHALALRTS